MVNQFGADPGANQQNRSLEANDECPEADAEADDDEFPRTKRGFKA